MSMFNIVIYHLSFVICHFSFVICRTKQRLLINLLKRLKMCIINITKVLLVVKTLLKKCYFFPGSVFEDKIVKQISNHTNQSADMKI